MIISKNAYEQILKNNKYLKIIITAGGCAGMKYSFEYVTEKLEEDVFHECIFENEFQPNQMPNEKFFIITNAVSKPFLENCSLTFVQEIGYENFLIKNEKAKKQCGCGISFF